MTLAQLMFALYFAFLGAYPSIVLFRVLKQNGRVLNKLDEGFRLIGSKMDEGFRRMDEGFRRMDEGFRKMDERAEQRHKEAMQQHQDIVEFLKQNQEIMKKGFGELIQQQVS
ncbi:MAG: hypothetical protein AB1349_04940 [Elusimicrobiota bacterium]